MEQKKILIVEDDIFIRDIYEVRFVQEGFDVVSAENGIIALEKLESAVLPDIILLDIMMPGMNGMEVLRRVKANDGWKEIPVIMLTNISDKERVNEGIALGIKDYLIKSHFTPSEVVQKVNTLLGA
jgi:DNA-binding response OmpR family regulator